MPIKYRVIKFKYYIVAALSVVFAALLIISGEVLLHREAKEEIFLVPSGIPIIKPSKVIDDICNRAKEGEQLEPELDQLIGVCEEI